MVYWHQNIAKIKERWPHLTKQLLLYTPQPLKIESAKDGRAIPLIANKALHSLYDPIKEAQRLLNPLSEGYLCIGLGAGYLAQEALAQKENSITIVIEPDTQDLVNLLAYVDYSSLLQDPRFILLSEEDIQGLLQRLSSIYQPLLHGNLSLIIPRIMSEIYPVFHQKFTEEWQKWLESLSRELSTWHYFGQRWFKNIVSNLTTIELEDHLELSPSIELALIAGAGPSLEKAIPEFRKAKAQGALLIASDASALTLQAYNLVADIILSIDAQMIVQYHFLGLENNYRYLIADLSVHPHLGDKKKRYFFAGSHPLAQMSGLRQLATDTGNVGTVAYQLAKILGAKKVMYAGLDFAYLHKKPYAYPNYLYSEYQSVASRTLPISQSIAALTFRSLPIHYESITESYQSDLLAFYKQKFQSTINNPSPYNPNWTRESINGNEFLQNYLHQLLSLTKKPSWRWNQLSSYEQHLLYTLFPSMTFGYQMGLRHRDLWMHSINFAITEIKNT